MGEDEAGLAWGLTQSCCSGEFPGPHCLGNGPEGDMDSSGHTAFTDELCSVDWGAAKGGS